MTQQPPQAPGPDDPPTSDRLYTTAELEEFARQQIEREAAERDAAAARVDPLSDPLTDPLDPAADRQTDPLSDPLPGHEPTRVSGSTGEPRPATEPPSEHPAPEPTDQSTDAGSGPLGPPPSGPPPGWQPSGPPPSGPPPAEPASWPQPPVEPSPPVAAEPAPQVQPYAGEPAGHPAEGLTLAPVERPSHPADQQPAASTSAGAAPRRFMTATDFLDRRDSHQELGPATWGWRGRLRRWSGGLINPAMGSAEQAYENDRHAIQKDFEGPRTIVFINPKGGAAKTTSVLAAGYTFGTVRGGGVVAWDNNETRGTLGIRGARSAHRNTTRELLEDLERFKDVYQSRIGDLGAFVRAQGDAHFDVLASDERPDVTGTIRAEDYQEVHALLERFYRIILVDTGNNMRAENWLAAADAADLLVVTTTVREDTGYSGLWMLDALQDAGYQNLKYKTITVMSDPSAKVDPKLAADLQQVYEQRTRGVYRVPYDPAMVAGSVVPYGQLSEGTTRSWLRACAAMAEAL